MRVLGGINPEYNDNGEVVNGSYVGGSIVLLTELEMSMLKKLQVAWDNDIFMFPAPTRYYDLDQRDMYDAFKAIVVFVEAKFAINEFKDAADRLDDFLIKKEVKSE